MLFSLLLPALAFDHSYAAYGALLKSYVANGRVDYAGIKAIKSSDGPAWAPGAPPGSPAPPLDGTLAAIAGADLSTFTESQRKAFYLNAYNALTLDLVVDNYPLNSIRDLDGGKVWDTRRFPVAGAQMTLNQIENDKLRPLGDPRIHAAINCAALSCPPLSSSPFVATALDFQLDMLAGEWARSIKSSPSSITLSRIFDWFSADFLASYGNSRFDIPNLSGKEEAALNFIATYDPARAPLLHSGALTVTFEEYNWALNRK